MGLFEKLKSYLPDFLKSKKVPECCPTPEDCKDECNDESCCCDEKAPEVKEEVLIQDSCSTPLQVVETPVVEAPVVETPVVEAPVEKVVERLVEVSAKEIKDKVVKKASPKKTEAPKKKYSKKKGK